MFKDRRRFLKWSLLSSAALPWTKIEANNEIPWPRSQGMEFSVLQGATDETRSQFSVVHKKSKPVQFVARTETSPILFPDAVETITHGDHPFQISKIYFSGLSLHTTYELLILDDQDNILQTRNFKTLDLDLETVRFSVASCMDDERHDPAIWQDMVDARPDLILFVGDSVYADRRRGSEQRVTATPAMLWDRFVEARRTLEIFNSKELIPILATWDDHDFGKNDTGGSYPYIVESQYNFLSFFAQEESHCRGLFRGPGVGSCLQFKNQQFLLMDDRSFREEKSNKPTAHWGVDQTEWAYELLKSFQGFSWIANGSQIVPAMIFKESLSKEHPGQLEDLFKTIRDHQIMAAFLSGDVHFSEISRLERELMGYVSYELTSSSIHSEAFPGVPTIVPNSRRIESTGRRNYLLVEAAHKAQALEMFVESRSSGGRVNFQRRLGIGP